MSYINSKILIWARERIGMSIEDLALRTKLSLEEVKMWESGKKAPSYKRLEDMAYKYYQVPIAVFFFPYPPQIENPKSKFRRLPDCEIEKFSDDTFKKICLAQAYQYSLFEILESNKPQKSIIGKFACKSVSPSNLAKDVRKYIGVSLEDQYNFRSNDQAFKQWRYAIEQVGVFTFKDTFKDKFISGFCLYDENYPVIMLNNSNSFTRQTFSLIHELGHVILGVNGVTDIDESYFNFLKDEELKTEIFCNQFASEFLVPSDEFKNDIKMFLQKGMDAVDEIANQYSVSREVILRKLLDNGVIKQKT